MRITWNKQTKPTTAKINTSGVQANALLQNEIFKTVMADIEEHYTNMWKDSGAQDELAREKLYLAIQILKKIKTQLNSYYQDYLVNTENGKIDSSLLKQSLNKKL